jgi:hypothetical protein
MPWPIRSAPTSRSAAKTSGTPVRSRRGDPDLRSAQPDPDGALGAVTYAARCSVSTSPESSASSWSRRSTRQILPALIHMWQSALAVWGLLQSALVGLNHGVSRAEAGATLAQCPPLALGIS